MPFFRFSNCPPDSAQGTSSRTSPDGVIMLIVPRFCRAVAPAKKSRRERAVVSMLSHGVFFTIFGTAKIKIIQHLTESRSPRKSVDAVMEELGVREGGVIGTANRTDHELDPCPRGHPTIGL